MRAAVIGAGAAGLATAKALREVGLTPVVFEATETVGGLWVYRDDPATGPAYRSLRTNTSKQVTAFSDFPFDDAAPDYLTREAVEGYLRAYAIAFGLMADIALSHEVHAVEWTRGGWRVRGVSPTGAFDERFDVVAVCAGIFRASLLPAIPGLETFTGTVIHSREYRVPEHYAGRRVVVVGLGSSAADVAMDLLPHAARVSIAVRRGAHVASRAARSRPSDHRATRLLAWLPRPAAARILRRNSVGTAAALWQAAGIPFDPATAVRVVNDDLPVALRSGTIDLRPAIERVEGEYVLFVDGRCERADAIVFATGYRIDVPFLPDERQPWRDVRQGLFRLVFDPLHPTLPFIGVCRVAGPVFPIVEMQARWAAQVLTGRVALPPVAEMRAEIAARWATRGPGNDPPIRVQLLPYLDELGAAIGVRPRLWRHPTLLRALLAGPATAAQYRLRGPHAWDGAAAAVRAAARRTAIPREPVRD